MAPEASSDQTTDDCTLIARVLAADDRAAFAALVNRHQRGVRTLLHRLANGDVALSDDLAQETFVRVYRNLGQFRAEARFSTGLYRITYNVFLAHARKTRGAEVDAHVRTRDAVPADDDASVATTQARQIDVARAVAQLDEAERIAVIHCYFEGLSHEQAALALNLPLGTLKSRLLRAREKLKRQLASWQPETLKS